MAIDFSVQNQTIQAQTSSVGYSHSAQQASGSLMGFGVKMANDPMSLLAQCAEELTFSVDTTDEFELSERKEKETIDLKNSDLIKRYSDVLKNGDKAQKFADLKAAIMSMKGMQNAQTLMQLARSLSENSGEAYAFLKGAYDDFKSENADPSLLKNIEEALNALELHDKGKIITSMQAELTRAEDTRFASINNGAALYTKTVNEFSNPYEVYSYVVDKCEGNIELALDFLYKMLGNDLASDMMSADKTKLESVSTSLGELRAFQSAHALCDRLVNRLKDVHNIENCPYNGFTFLGKILDMKKEVYLSSSSVEALARTSRVANPEEEVLFLQELQTTTRQFSSTIFNGDQERTKVLDAMQLAVDDAVAREDEWLLTLE